MPETENRQGFRALDLAPSILAKLDRLGFVTPTPIQQQAIPFALQGRDVIGIAQTGTGKTLAFGLPMVARLRTVDLGLVLAPTRELAQQIEEELIKLGVKTALLIGGAPMGRQIAAIRRRPSVVVATPGRLMDHMEQGTVDLRRVAVAVLDEADRMLDMGFAPAIKKILSATPDSRQTMLFSATMPREIEDLADQFLRNPERIEIARPGTAAESVEQELLVLPHEEKQSVLADILADNPGSVLVFARTRHGARKVAKAVRTMGHSSAELHSDRTLAQRQAALAGFKSGAVRVLVATDIAARGIDVKDISLVVNYDVPEHAEDYVHRIGRTGRAGSTGRAITLATPEQQRDVRDIERLLKTELPLSPNTRLRFERPAARPVGPSRGGPRRPFRGPRKPFARR